MKTKYILSLIIFIAVVLRFYQLDRIPASITADESALGYTAYSLLKTGADTHGFFFPLTYSAFGSAWTLVGYPLIDIIPQIFLGLNEFSVRLPSALAGVGGVILIYFLADALFKNKKTALLAAIVYTISPWNIYFSRMAYEVNLALPFFLSGLLFFVKYIYGNKKDSYLFYSAVLFSITQFIYYSFVIFIPVFFLGLFLFYRRRIVSNKKKTAIYIISLLSIVISCLTIFRSSIGEVSTLSIFNDRNIIYERSEVFRTDHAVDSVLISKFLHTKYLGIPYQFAQNYINSFTPGFLFDKGGSKIVNDIGIFGKLYILDSLFLLIGFASLFYRKEKSLPILSIWFFAAPISSAFTRDAPSSTRLFLLMPLLVLLVAYGINQFIGYFSGLKFGKFAVGIVGLLFLLNFIYFIDLYYIHFNKKRVRFLGYGNEQVVEVSKKFSDYKVVMRGPENFPFIYFLFYTQYDPKKFRKEVQYYPSTSEGFRFVKNFGRYTFVDSIDYNKLSPNTIYIDDRSPQNIKHTINLPSGEPILGYTISGDDKK